MQGDSGGPLLCRYNLLEGTTKRNNQWVQIGIASEIVQKKKSSDTAKPDIPQHQLCTMTDWMLFVDVFRYASELVRMLPRVDPLDQHYQRFVAAQGKCRKFREDMQQVIG